MSCSVCWRRRARTLRTFCGLYSSRFSEKEAMEISGHKTRHVFDRYHIVSSRRMKELAQKMESHLNALEEAIKEGSYVTPFGKFPRLQILTVELLSRKTPQIPFVDSSAFKVIPPEKVGQQQALPLGPSTQATRGGRSVA